MLHFEGTNMVWYGGGTHLISYLFLVLNTSINIILPIRISMAIELLKSN